MDQFHLHTNSENITVPRLAYIDATIEEGPNSPEEMVIGLSPSVTAYEQNQDELMWVVPVQEKGPHLPQELAMTS